MPSVEAWNAAIKAEGFDVVLDPFDPSTDDCYRPALLKSEESGFEWYLSDVTTISEVPGYPFKAFIGDSDVRAELCFTSYANEDVVSAIAGALLAKLSGGYYWDPETDTRFLRNDEAVSAARRLAKERGVM